MPPITGTNESQNGEGATRTWDTAYDTWEETTGTLDNPRSMGQKDSQNAITGTGNEAQNTAISGTNESQN
mgnify:CR=1 FL=1